MRRLDLSSLRQLASSSALWRSRWLPVAAALVALGVYVAVGSLTPTPVERRPTSASPTVAAGEAPGGYLLPTPQPEADGSLGLAEPDWPALLLDVGLKLALTLGLAYTTIYLLRRYVARPIGQRKAARVSVVETVSLGQHRALHLIRVGGKLVLVGATQQQITLLTEVADAEGTADGKAAGRQGEVAPGPFAQSEARGAVPVEDPFGDRLRALLAGGHQPSAFSGQEHNVAGGCDPTDS